MKSSKEKAQLLKLLNHELSTDNASPGQEDVNKITRLSQQSYQNTHKDDYYPRHKKIPKHQQIFKSVIPPITNSKVLETTLVYALLKLYQKSSCKFIYNNLDSYKNANDISYSFNFCSLRTLLSLKLVKIKSYHVINKQKGTVKCKAKITPLGKLFVQHFFLKHHWLIKEFKHLRFLKIILALFGNLIVDLIITFLYACVVEFFGGIEILLFIIVIFHESNSEQCITACIISFIVIIISIIWAHSDDTTETLHNHYNNLPINDDTVAYFLRLIARTATRTQVTQFLKQHHVEIPNYKFTMQSKLPSLCDSIFVNRKDDLGTPHNQLSYDRFQHKIKKMASKLN